MYQSIENKIPVAVEILWKAYASLMEPVSVQKTTKKKKKKPRSLFVVFEISLVEKKLNQEINIIGY